MWEEVAICILDLGPEKPHQTEDFVRKEQVDVAQCQLERGLVCDQEQAAKES